MTTQGQSDPSSETITWGRRKGVTAKAVVIGSLTCLVVALICLAVCTAALSLRGTQEQRPEKTVDEMLKEGSVYIDLGSYQDALSCFNSALQKDQDNIDALRGVGRAYLALDYLDKAEDTYTKLVDAPSEDPQDALELINIKLRLGKMKEAKTLTKRMKKRFDDDGFKSLYKQMTVKSPKFSVSSGSYDSYQLLDLVEQPDGTVIYYTLDGTNPTVASAEFEYPIPLTAPTNTFKAIAVSYLGYKSKPVSITVNITKTPKQIESDNRSLYHLFEDKTRDDPIFDWELASVTELYLLGEYVPRSESYGSAVFYSSGFSLDDNYYGEDYDGSESLQFLSDMPFLRKLAVCYQKSFDIELISNLNHLEELSLIHDNIDNLGKKGSWPNSLRRLSLGWNQISDVSPLAKLTNLELLGLWGNNVKDIDSLSRLKSLSCLDVSNNNLSDVSVVGNMPALTELWVNGNAVKDLSPVNKLTLLRRYMQGGNPGSNKGLAVEIANQLRKTDYTKGDK